MPPDAIPPAPAEASQTARRSSCRAAAHHRRPRRARIAAVIVVMGITTRKMADAKLQEWTESAGRAGRRRRACPIPAARRTTFELPGRLEAYTQAQIYARVSGYVKEWKADIGTPVKAGQLLAEIDAPDLDQQIMQAASRSGQRQGQFRACRA